MKQQRLLKLTVVFFIPLTLLAVLMAAANTAAPAATSDHNPAQVLPSAASDNFSIVARRVISIPYMVDDSVLPTPAGSQIVARRVISIPYMVDDSMLPTPASSQIVARRVISIPYMVDGSVLPTPAGSGNVLWPQL